MDDRTRQLDLTAPIPTGNIKAAAAAAGATSADLWMVPYEQLHYDPADNIRAVDTEWVAHLAALMRENGYDKGSPSIATPGRLTARIFSTFTRGSTAISRLDT